MRFPLLVVLVLLQVDFVQGVSPEFSAIRALDLKATPRIVVDVKQHAGTTLVEYDAKGAQTQDWMLDEVVFELWIDREKVAILSAVEGAFHVDARVACDDNKQHEFVVCGRESATSNAILAIGRVVQKMGCLESPPMVVQYSPRAKSALGHSSSSIVSNVLGMSHTTSNIQIFTYPNMSRHDIPLLVEKMGFKGAGAEVGVWQGAFSEKILQQWPSCTHFYLVDLYLNDEMGVEPGDPRWITQEQMDDIMHQAQNRMSAFGPKAEFLRENSMMAALAVPNESLDFVYMDTSVGRENVLHDLLAWYPAVRPGGILSGHDYYNGAGATAGALEFLALKVGGDIEIHVTGEEVASFFFFKPECPKIQYTLSELSGKLSESEKKLVQLLDAERSFDSRVRVCGEMY